MKRLRALFLLLLIGFILVAYQTGRTVADCSETEMKCRDGSCIPNLWQCDNETDCPQGEDESQEICGGSGNCSANRFQCSSGECIPTEWECDSVADCDDGSDEMHCGSTEALTDSGSTVAMATTMSTKKPKSASKIRPHLLEGSIGGMLNNISLNDVTLNCYVTAMDGRSFVSYSPISPSLMTSFSIVIYEISSVIGWLFAVPENANGYAYTDGKFIREATITYENGNSVTIRQSFPGSSGKHTMHVITHVEGTVPSTDVKSSIILKGYKDTFQAIQPEIIESVADRQITIGNSSLTYTVSQRIQFDAVGSQYSGGSLETMYLYMEHSKISLNKASGVARVTMKSMVSDETVRSTTVSDAGTRSTAGNTTGRSGEPLAIKPPDPESKPIAIYLGTAGGIVVVIIVAVIAVVIIGKKRKQRTFGDEQVNDVVQTAENAEYMEMTDGIYEEIKLEESEYMYTDVCNSDTRCRDAHNGGAENECSVYITPVTQALENDYEVPVKRSCT